VLYEMATGKAAFPGKTSAIVFKAILDQTPPPPSELNKLLPDRLDEVIGKSLEKDRELRYQSAAELRADLKRIQRDSESQRISATAVKSGRLLGSVPSRSKKTLTAALTALLVITIVFGVYQLRKPWQARVAFREYQITPLTSTGNVGDMDISRDGRYLVYVTDEFDQLSMWVRQIATATNVRVLGPLPSNVHMRRIRVSPDGNYLYYLQDDPKKNLSDLYRLAIVGGPPVKILSNADAALAISFDGSKIGFARYNAKAAPPEGYLTVADSDGTNEKRLLTLKHP
jgi:eukaryotic-like serine/threonine-protein kinase